MKKIISIFLVVLVGCAPNYQGNWVMIVEEDYQGWNYLQIPEEDIRIERRFYADDDYVFKEERELIVLKSDRTQRVLELYGNDEEHLLDEIIKSFSSNWEVTITFDSRSINDDSYHYLVTTKKQERETGFLKKIPPQENSLTSIVKQYDESGENKLYRVIKQEP
ncbi:hypothetical protein ERUR111494_08020 [Erysipelothrix urinaevulpis]|uniref:hypothetical protein n=1 Tax=Erysipelothrix urinaevulpis TaxID=2683717 RepID=UPI00135CD00F|nr:hypothetical protein [Erysipelothrix urinaevulpis]